MRQNIELLSIGIHKCTFTERIAGLILDSMYTMLIVEVRMTKLDAFGDPSNPTRAKMTHL